MGSPAHGACTPSCHTHQPGTPSPSPGFTHPTEGTPAHFLAYCAPLCAQHHAAPPRCCFVYHLCLHTFCVLAEHSTRCACPYTLRAHLPRLLHAGSSPTSSSHGCLGWGSLTHATERGRWRDDLLASSGCDCDVYLLPFAALLSISLKRRHHSAVAISPGLPHRRVTFLLHFLPRFSHAAPGALHKRGILAALLTYLPLSIRALLFVKNTWPNSLIQRLRRLVAYRLVTSAAAFLLAACV